MRKIEWISRELTADERVALARGEGDAYALDIEALEELKRFVDSLTPEERAYFQQSFATAAGEPKPLHPAE